MKRSQILTICILLAASAYAPPAMAQMRDRPHLNAARTTFVADNDRPLRGPYTSTEWTGATSYDQIAKMKALGFNAVHLYGESFDPNYPNAGSTAPGYATSRIDSIVQSTRDLGLYLVITIGNGANNGNYNLQYVTNFWKLYSARYANETHVMFEIQNEPVAWGPPYSSPTATPPGAVNMEIAAYNAIRANAPNTPVLIFSYAVLGGTGGANSALTDIRAFNQTVFGSQNVVWTNLALGFHGYAGAKDTAIAVSNIISAGYPCFMTEFGDGTWGGGPGGLDVEGVANWERLGVSWLAFAYIPPSGVSDDVTKPEVYSNRVVNAGLSWTPDYGTFPKARSVYGNSGNPWTTPDYINNTLSGTLRIEAENFDIGGKGIAYFNNNITNFGGKYRTNETVSIETTSDAGGGYDVNSTATGDWLEYTMKVPQAGLYNLRLRVAGSGGSVRLLAGVANGANLIGTWAVPGTGGSQTWTTITTTVFLAPGRQVLHLDVLAGGFSLNWIEFSPVSSGPIANGTYKILNAGSGKSLDLETNNNVITTVYSGTTTQQWTLQHIGGGQYRVNSLAKGNSWYAWAGVLRLLPWGWGAGGDTCYIFRPTSGGFYRFMTSGSGTSFGPTSANPPQVDDSIYAGSASQQWAIVSPSSPAFPIGLNAVTILPNGANLTWNAVTGATSYNVKRSITSGGPYTTLATGVTSTNFADSGLVAGFGYYYVVSTVIGANESINSAEAVVLPPWQWQDIGSTGIPGSTTYSNGVFALAGSGADIWGTVDAFRFAYVPVTGNCAIIARVTSLQNVDQWSKAGVMIRASLAANAANALIAVTPGNGVTWQTRSSTGGNTANNNTTGLSAPYWVRLVRSGNTFTGSRSPDGVTWTQLGTATFAMSSTAYIGLALTSHNNSSLGTATFDNVTVPGWTTPSAAPIGVVATPVSTNQINLTWNTLSNATSYHVKRSLTNGGPYAPIASGVTATNCPDSGLAGGTMYYYVVSAVVSGSETPNSGQATAATLSPALGSLVHRYSFSEPGGASIADSVGGPVWNGTLPNGGTFASGQLTFASTPQQHAQLSAGIVSTLSNFTMVTWVRLNSTTNWARIFDFGNSTTVNMFLTPQNGGDGRLRFVITTNGGGANEQQINTSSAMSVGVSYQVAVTLTGNTGILYLNGLPVGTNNTMTLRPSSLGSTANNYLGRSQYPDPYLDGSLDEFRIYNVGLSAAEIAATAALGPNQLLSASSPQMSVASSGTNLTLSWPLASAGYTLQSSTNLGLGNWLNVTSPVPQIIGGQWQVVLPLSASIDSTFYRLAK